MRREEAGGATQPHWGLCGHVGGASSPCLAEVMFVIGSSVTAITDMRALKDTLRDPCRPSGVGPRG